MDWFQCKCYVHGRIPRIQSSAGIKTISIPWADASSRVMDAFERWAIDWLLATKNQTKTAQLLRCGFHRLHGIMRRSVARGMKRRTLEGVAHVSMDEKAMKRGHVYASIVCDSTRGVVLDVGEGRTKKGTIALLERIFEQIKDQVETVSVDMWKAFIGAVEKVFPKAALIHDRFHLIQYLNKVRRREVNAHPEELKGSRYALLKNEKNRTKTQEEVLKVIQEANLEVSVAWRFREDFKAIFNCQSYAEARTDFDHWTTSVEAPYEPEIMRSTLVAKHANTRLIHRQSSHIASP